MQAQTPSPKTPAYLELKIWRLHNTPENQGPRLADYLENGLMPALSRAGAELLGAFSTVIGPDSPSYFTLVRYASMAAMQDNLEKLQADSEHKTHLQKLDSGSGLPFVRVESSLLRSFDVLAQPSASASGSAAGSSRIFELRTYESQNFSTLRTKVGMFNEGEAKIFERLGFRPVFFGETVIGPKQPNLTYMLSYDDLAARDRLWQSFGKDPEWKKLSGRPELKDSEIVANISNTLVSPLPFSPTR